MPWYPKFRHNFVTFLRFLRFFVFFCLMWLDWDVLWVFQRIRTNSNNFCEKSYIWLNIWAKWGKNWPKMFRKFIYGVSNNATTSEVYIIILWNKKHWKADKIVFLLIIFLYIFENFCFGNLHQYSKYSRNLLIFVIFWGFLQFFLCCD